MLIPPLMELTLTLWNCQALVQVQSSPSRRTRVESMVPTAHHHHHHHHRKLFKFLIAMYIQSRVKTISVGTNSDFGTFAVVVVVVMGSRDYNIRQNLLTLD